MGGAIFQLPLCLHGVREYNFTFHCNINGDGLSQNQDPVDVRLVR